MKYEATKRSASERWGNSNKSLLPLPSPIPAPIPRSSSNTTVEGDDSASDSLPTPDASAMLLLAARAFGILPVDAEAFPAVGPPPTPAVGVVAAAMALPPVWSVVFGEVTFVIKSKAEDSPKYSPGKAEWLLFGRSERCSLPLWWY